VAESAVVGAPDPIRHTIVKAFIILAPLYHHLHDDMVKAQELVKELQDFVKRTTGPYKYPRAIEFVKELPKTVSGKIRRVELRMREWEGYSSHGKKLSKL
jgi:acyl-coenzyme A synthetase/AMP-(fatty) acid ligase